MKLKDMTDAEMIALGTLVRVIVTIDGEHSLEESAQLQAVAAELGEEAFWELIRLTGKQHHTEEIVNAQAAAVERQAARETIYGVLFRVAAAGSIVSQEGHLLDQLATTWNLKTSTEVATNAG